ncbi:MAG: NAD(P)/FAD-dependent oxidoreductase [Gammaproteobacteria bacterium]
MAIETDAVIVGAGPCGLFQVFELGLHGLSAHVVDSISAAGGQCIELYPDKPIYDIPAIPVCTAEELVERLLEQIKPFEPGMHLGEEVVEVHGDGSEPFRVVTNAGTEFLTKTVIIAGGVGSFQPRRIRAKGADVLEDKSVFYRVRDASQFDGRDVIVAGGGDSALDWAVALAESANSVTLIHRRDEYRAAEATVAQARALQSAGKLTMIENTVIKNIDHEDDAITGVDILINKETEQRLNATDILVFFGLAPKLGPIAEWGLSITRKTIDVDTEKFQTNVPGIFAVGDINNYPGKKKLILSGFHEAALAAVAAKAHIEPGKKVHLQYTTTSPLVQQRLGVADEE